MDPWSGGGVAAEEAIHRAGVCGPRGGTTTRTGGAEEGVASDTATGEAEKGVASGTVREGSIFLGYTESRRSAKLLFLGCVTRL